MQNGNAAVALPEEVPQAPIAAATPAPNSPVANPAIVGTLTREEFLEIENLSLKVQNVALQTQRMQTELIKANEMRQGLQKDLDAARQKLSAKYNVDILAQTTQITPEGVIIDMTRLPAPARPGVPVPAKVD